jgi:hypothetical protein
LKETEKQKEIIKEKETKINELEKDKKDKERSKVLTTDEVQNDFSNVYTNSNISSITNSGTATPFFSRPVDPNELYDLLRRESDLRGGNPNSGQITFATLQSNAPSSNSTLTTQSSDGIDQRFVSTRETAPEANTTRNTIARLWLGKARQSIADRLANTQQEDLSTYMTQAPPKDPTETKMQSKYEELYTDEIEAEQVVSPEVIPVAEDPVIDEVLEDIEPESQIVVYGSPTKETIPKKNDIDNSTPSPVSPINTPLPSVYLEDVINNTATPFYQKLKERRDKKPVLAIEPQSTQDEAEDTIRLLTSILKPKPQPTPPKPPKPPKPPVVAAVAAEEPNDSNLDESPELRALKDNFKKDGKYQYNWQMGQLLIDNDIRDPKTGNKFYINPSNKVLVRGGDRAIDKEGLKDVILKSFNDKKIKKL